MPGVPGATVLFLGSYVLAGLSGGVNAELHGRSQEISRYADLTGVLLEIKGAQEGFLEALEGVSDPAAIGVECDSLGGRFEAFTPVLQEALGNHPELKAELPDEVKAILDPCIETFLAWDAFMNATVLPLANERPDVEALHTGFGRLNAALFYMKYARDVMTLGKGG
jgi:hypothetical protein